MSDLHAALTDLASDERRRGENAAGTGQDDAAAPVERYPLSVRLRLIALLAVLLWVVIWITARGLLHAFGPR
jgi:type VI protein secretion system component VasF